MIKIVFYIFISPGITLLHIYDTYMKRKKNNIVQNEGNIQTKKKKTFILKKKKKKKNEETVLIRGIGSVNVTYIKR